MKHVTFYSLETGVLNGVSVLVSDDDAVKLNERLYPGHKAIEHPGGSRLDHRTQRVDIETGELTLRLDFKETDQAAAPTSCPCPKHG